MGAAARFHDDQADGPIGKPALELAARQACAFDHAPLRIGDRQLKDVLGKIDSNNGSSRSSIHLGLSLAALR
jgi:hypothetical protein